MIGMSPACGRCLRFEVSYQLPHTLTFLQSFDDPARHTYRTIPQRSLSLLPELNSPLLFPPRERFGLPNLIAVSLGAGALATRCARRDAIPTVIRDLRDEWATARKKVWNLLNALRKCGTFNEGSEIRKQLSEASRLYSPSETDVDTRPVRVLWEILGAAAAGAAIGQLSGGNPIIGAATGTVAQAARSLQSVVGEFGPLLFGRGAFDLARKVHRETSKVEFGALSRLLSDKERRKLGLN